MNAPYPCVATPRNCGRCGNDFNAADLSRVCPQCKTPARERQMLRGSGDVDLAGKPLTLREKQITALIVEGLLNKQIAFDLHLSEGTVKTYLWTVFQKAGVGNRTELAVMCLRNPGMLAAAPQLAG